MQCLHNISQLIRSNLAEISHCWWTNVTELIMWAFRQTFRSNYLGVKTLFHVKGTRSYTSITYCPVLHSLISFQCTPVY